MIGFRVWRCCGGGGRLEVVRVEQWMDAEKGFDRCGTGELIRPVRSDSFQAIRETMIG